MAPLTRSMDATQYGYQRLPVTGELTTHKGIHVDFGTSGIRCAYFYRHGDGRSDHVIIKNDGAVPDAEGEGFESRGWERAVRIYPFDDAAPGQAVYPGSVPYLARRPISAKYAFYPLVGMYDESFEQYRPAVEIREHADRDPAFKGRLEQGIDAILCATFESAKVVIGQTGDRSSKGVDTLTATMPAQWTIDFERYYGNRLSQAFLKVFGYPTTHLLFHTEAQAGLQYMLHRNDMEAACDWAGIGGLMDKRDKSNIVLLLDVGSHATNSALVSVGWNQDEQPFLLQLEKDVGASGGTYAWEHEVMEKIKDDFLTAKGVAMPVRLENELRTCFHRNKTDIQHGKPTILYSNNVKDSESIFRLSHDATFEAWEKAFRPTMTLIDAQLRKLKKLQHYFKMSTIVVCGGSSRHQIFRDSLRKACEQHGVNVQPSYLARCGREDEYARLALGASYASAKIPSSQDILAAASFGLRVKATGKGDGETTKDRAPEIFLLWSQAGGSTDVCVNSTDEEEAEIVCQATLGNLADSRRMTYLPPEMPTYPVLRLAHLPRGRSHIRLELDTAGWKMTLSLMEEVPTECSASEEGGPSRRVLASAICPIPVWASSQSLYILRRRDHGEGSAPPGLERRSL